MPPLLSQWTYQVICEGQSGNSGIWTFKSDPPCTAILPPPSPYWHYRTVKCYPTTHKPIVYLSDIELSRARGTTVLLIQILHFEKVFALFYSIIHDPFIEEGLAFRPFFNSDHPKFAVPKTYTFVYNLKNHTQLQHEREDLLRYGQNHLVLSQKVIPRWSSAFYPYKILCATF